MIVRENVPLAPYTTFHLGGPARFFIEAKTREEVEAARVFAHERKLPLMVLGGGSNLLVPDEGVPAVVLRFTGDSISFEEQEGAVRCIAEAGARWDDVVTLSGARGLWGIENLAGIPGTVGGAAVQNIGAYGGELSETFEYAEVLDRETGAYARIEREAARFGYRTSIFKQSRKYVLLRIGLLLRTSGAPNLSYRDLERAKESGVPLASPPEIARAVRAIRAEKFPDLSKEGTAGSFFENPSLLPEQAASLLARFPELPHFPQKDGRVKIAIAWILDNVLHMKGTALGGARPFEKHALVLVARAGARATDVDALAHDIAERVHALTGITLTREVETFRA